MSNTVLRTAVQGAVAALLPGGRLHLQHGPIDLVCQVDGKEPEVAAAYRQGWERFQLVLAPLAAQLHLLQTPIDQLNQQLQGEIARRMWEAVRPYTGKYVTPMAAVAGAVADEVLAAMVAGRQLFRASVNNGGDIAVYLQPEAGYVLGVVDDVSRPEIRERIAVTGEEPVRGIATSGWAGRSWSLGIADAVTVFASTAAAADAAATLVANAVNVEDPLILRQPADHVFEEGDLATLLVTTGVGDLTPKAVNSALDAGGRMAEELVNSKLVFGALLFLKGQRRSVGRVPLAKDLSGLESQPTGLALEPPGIHRTEEEKPWL